MKTFGHEETYRGEKLLKAMAEQSIIVCGAGAIGSNLVNNMVRQGFERITVIDMDRVEDHNRHTQVWGRRDVGQLKAAMLRNKMQLEMVVGIEAIPKKLDLSNVRQMLKPGSIVIDGFDNFESRRIVTEHCRDIKIECLHVGLYRDCAEVTWNDSYRVPDNVKGMDVCEYPLARNVIIMAVAVATEVLIRYLDKKRKESYTITLGDFRILKQG